MAILWCGGEDIDFKAGSAPSVNTGLAFRSAWARCAVHGASVKSAAFPGGALTNFWFCCTLSPNNSTSTKQVGVMLSSTTASGLWIATAAASGTRLALVKYDGTTTTVLATESGDSLTATNHRIDIQVVSFGASATVNVYVDGLLVVNFSGDVTVSGVSNIDAVGIGASSAFVSEVIVSDVDTRPLQGLATLALTGAGTTNTWTNPTFSNINGTSFSDTNPTNSNTAAQDNQYNVTDLPTGTFQVKAVKISMRAAVSSSPTATQIKMGYNSGGSIAFGTGSTKTPAAAYATIEQLDDATNPVTSAAWAQSEMNALQLDFRSA